MARRAKSPDLSRNREAAVSAVSRWNDADLELPGADARLATSTGLSRMDASAVIAEEKAKRAKS
jgi:hypothetical protein